MDFMRINSTNLFVNSLKAGILLLIILVCIFLSRNLTLINEPLIASAITFDLTITLPFVYWLFIRKTKISKLTVASFIFVGIIAASFILPENNRQFLDYVKYFGLPVLEFGLFTYAGLAIYKGHKKLKSIDENHGDFYENLREKLSAVFSEGLLAKAVSFEVAGFYYAFLRWKAQERGKTFTYHKKNGTLALLIVFGFMVAIESLVMHLLVVRLSVTIAWILTASSIYFLFQIYAHGKAIFVRPVEITAGKLFVRCGLLGDAEIELTNIESIEKSPSPSKLEPEEIKLTPLGSFTESNLKISLRDEAVSNGFYGRSKVFRKIYLSIDEADTFIEEIAKAEKGD